MRRTVGDGGALITLVMRKNYLNLTNGIEAIPCVSKSLLSMNKKELQEHLNKHPIELRELYTPDLICKVKWSYIPVSFIKKHAGLIKQAQWMAISRLPSLKESFIHKHKDFVDWTYISKYQKLSEQFIDTHKDLVDWYHISTYQKLSEQFIDTHKDLVDWYHISMCQKLSEQFIDTHKDLVYWYHISTCQKLSEQFIEDHKSWVAWDYISTYQKLSEQFIDNHKGLVDWNNISRFQKLSKEFVDSHKQYLNIELIVDNWLNKSTEFKKKEVISTGLYECYDDYFIAYKGIRSDRYSKFNFQYQYLPGATYECFADGSADENSFGLSVWTEEKAGNYSSELVVKCKIYYEDVARVVHRGGKIRCSKITILS